MLNEKDTIKCESIFNDERTHRFWWKRVWDAKKPIACVIMLNACIADTVIMDMSTFLTVNAIVALEDYGGVIIVNLFSKLTSKLNFRWNGIEDLNLPENDDYIKKAAEESEVVILAWGKGASNNHSIEERAVDVINLLDALKPKMRVITDGEKTGLHPLTPSIRNKWQLLKLSEVPAVEEKAKEAKAEEADTEEVSEAESNDESANEPIEVGAEESTEETIEESTEEITEEPTND